MLRIVLDVEVHEALVLESLLTAEAGKSEKRAMRYPPKAEHHKGWSEWCRRQARAVRAQALAQVDASLVVRRGP